MFCLENWLIIFVQSDLQIQIVNDSLSESNLIELAIVTQWTEWTFSSGSDPLSNIKSLNYMHNKYSSLN